jgi:hypothetical protein
MHSSSGRLRWRDRVRSWVLASLSSNVGPLLSQQRIHLSYSGLCFSSRRANCRRIFSRRSSLSAIFLSAIFFSMIFFSMIFVKQRSMQHRHRLRGCATCGSHSPGHRSNRLSATARPALTVSYLGLIKHIVDCANEGPIWKGWHER